MQFYEYFAWLVALIKEQIIVCIATILLPKWLSNYQIVSLSWIWNMMQYLINIIMYIKADCYILLNVDILFVSVAMSESMVGWWQFVTSKTSS